MNPAALDLALADLRVPADFYARRAEALPVGRGQADLGVVVQPDLQAATLDVTHRFSKGVSGWAHGHVGRFRGRWAAGAAAGLRLSW